MPVDHATVKLASQAEVTGLMRGGRKQDRAGVASGQDYEVTYDTKKSRRSASAVKKVVNARLKVEKKFAR